MKISSRGTAFPPSPIRKLVPYEEEARAGGAEVFRLNIGQPDIETPPPFWSAVRGYSRKVLEYGHSAGFAELRQAFAAYYRGVGYEVDAENVTVTTGGSEAIQFAFLACADPGDEILCFEPFYTNYNSFALAAGVRLVAVTGRAEDGYHLPPVAEIEARIGPRTRALLCCSPNNPTGTVLRPDEMAVLAGVARRHGLFVLSDEAYREFVYEGRHTGVLELGLGDGAVLIDSLSKRFSACGARIGCVVTRNRELQSAFLHLGQARLCPPTLEQAGALPLFALEPGFYRGVQEEYRRRRDVVVDALAQVPGVVCKRPEGAFYVMARLPVVDAEDFAIWLLRKFRHQGATVMVAPGNGFYATPGLGASEVRIAYVLDVERLGRAMECFTRGLAEYPGARA